MIETLLESVAINNLLTGIVNRSMKNMMIEHARSRGASEAWIDGLKDMHARTVHQVVSLIYGEPEAPAAGPTEFQKKLMAFKNQLASSKT